MTYWQYSFKLTISKSCKTKQMYCKPHQSMIILNHTLYGDFQGLFIFIAVQAKNIKAWNKDCAEPKQVVIHINADNNTITIKTNRYGLKVAKGTVKKPLLHYYSILLRNKTF